MRILHGIEEIAGQGSYSVKGLKENYQDVKMVTYYSNLGKYPCDISFIMDTKKLWLYPWYLIKIIAFFIYSLFRFDVFHFHFGTSLVPKNLDLIFLKLFRKKIFFEFHGSDLRTTKIAEKINPKLFLKHTSPIIDKRIMRKNKRLLRYADGIILHDEELFSYLPIVKRNVPIHIVPLRMDLSPFVPVYPEEHKKIVTIVHAPSHREAKGTESVLAAIKNLEKKYELEFILVENLPNAQALEIYKKADIIVDQLRGGSYGVFSIEAMALGKPVIVFIIEDVRKTYPPSLPIVNANVDTIQPALEKLIINGKLRNELGRAGHEYAGKYHDCKKIAKLLLKIYKNEHKPIFGPEAYEEANNI
jgi:glycosyltransferase involved in cell wall biosynthesis